MATPSPSPRPSASQQKKAPFLPSGCRSILWALAILTALGALSIYKFGQQIHGIRKREAMFMSRAIGNAIEVFFSEHGTLPLTTNTTPPGSDIDTDSSPTHPITNILLGKEPEGSTLQNPHKSDFLEGIKPAKKPKPPGKAPSIWINGIYTDEITGSHGVVDPWGNPFKIRLDTNNDKELANPNPDQVKERRPVVLKRVLVWSAGKDGNWDTWDDNPMSWD